MSDLAGFVLVRGNPKEQHDIWGCPAIHTKMNLAFVGLPRVVVVDIDIVLRLGRGMSSSKVLISKR